MKKLLSGLTLAMLLSTPVYAGSTSGSLQNRGQEMSNWCWAANSEMILDWDGTETNQTEIAAFGVAGANIGNYLDTGTVNGWGPFRNPFTGTVYFQKGVKQVLDHFGDIKADVLNKPLLEADAKGFLDNEKPFIVRLDWGGGGAHVAVAKDYAGSNFQIEDPWPLNSMPAVGTPGVSASVPYSSLLGTTPNYSMLVFGSGGTNAWSRTLTLGKALDIVFLIDSTGSMGPYIDNVKSQATVLLGDLETSFEDLRVAVVDYRDFPMDPYGSPGDYVTLVRTPFTDDPAAAIAAINAISIGGGNDFPEAVFSAVENTAVGLEIGGWREGEGVSRHIILMGDAPGHEPEPWPGGKGILDCEAALNNPLHPIRVQAVHVGGDSLTGADFTALSALSGGQTVSSITADDVSGLIAGVIEDISSRRFPVGSTSDTLPTFTWPNIGGGVASAPDLKKLIVELEYNDPKRGWRKYKRFKVKDLTANSIGPRKPLPIGEFRWRLAGSTKATTFQYPDGTTAKAEKLGKFNEEDTTTFNRLSNAPSFITKITENCPFPSEKRYSVLFRSHSAADAYAIQVTNLSTGKQKTKKFKPKKLTATEDGVLSAALKVKPGEQFCWAIQGLNFDRKKPDPDAFN